MATSAPPATIAGASATASREALRDGKPNAWPVATVISSIIALSSASILRLAAIAELSWMTRTERATTTAAPVDWLSWKGHRHDPRSSTRAMTRRSAKRSRNGFGHSLVSWMETLSACARCWPS
jgi:hypothetical protein